MTDDRKTPQEKKSLSYAKNRRNTYGENDKASRKSIPLAKALSIRADRHEKNLLLATAVGLESSDRLTAVENDVRAVGPRFWRKMPDSRLGEVLGRKAVRRRAQGSGASYVKRHWDESRGDAYDAWGTSWWYFEVDSDGSVMRQIEEYNSGRLLRYGPEYEDDEFNRRTDERIDFARPGLHPHFAARVRICLATKLEIQ